MVREKNRKRSNTKIVGRINKTTNLLIEVLKQ